MLIKWRTAKLGNFIIVSLIVIISASVISGCGNSTAATQQVWGRAEAKEVDINSKIPGRVINLFVKEGEQVEKDQLLARIDNRDIIAKANQAKSGVAALESQLAQSSTVTSLQDQTLKASLSSANAQLDNANANLSLTEKDANRFNELAASGAVSQQTVDGYRAKYQSAQAAYAAAQAGV